MIRDTNMMSIVGNKKKVQFLNAEEFEFNGIERELKNSSIPKFEFRQIYKRGNFEMLNSYHFKILEFTTPANTRESYLLIIMPRKVTKARENNYKLMHIGAVQVG